MWNALEGSKHFHTIYKKNNEFGFCAFERNLKMVTSANRTKEEKILINEFYRYIIIGNKWH